MPGSGVEGGKMPPCLLCQKPLDDNEVAKFSEFSLTEQGEFCRAAARRAFIKGDLLQYLPFV
jgi:hypothetical protein